jgi:hypothetical protein
MPMMTICEYCATANPVEALVCNACGAPLPIPKPKSTLAPEIEIISTRTPSITQNIPTQEIRQTGEKLDKAYTAAFSAYATLWRTLAETAAIAITGFGIGFVGGAMGPATLGLIGATAVGLVVGLSHKNYYLTLLGAPIGLVASVLISILLWFLKASPTTIVIIITLGSILAAWIGSYHIPPGHLNWWEKVRPWLGTAGGFVFGMLGVLLGYGIRSIIQTVIG